MFVQTHFQRARRQAALSSAAGQSAAGTSWSVAQQNLDQHHFESHDNRHQNSHFRHQLGRQRHHHHHQQQQQQHRQSHSNSTDEHQRQAGSGKRNERLGRSRDAPRSHTSQQSAGVSDLFSSYIHGVTQILTLDSNGSIGNKQKHNRDQPAEPQGASLRPRSATTSGDRPDFCVSATQAAQVHHPLTARSSSFVELRPVDGSRSGEGSHALRHIRSDIFLSLREELQRPGKHRCKRSMSEWSEANSVESGCVQSNLCPCGAHDQLIVGSDGGTEPVCDPQRIGASFECEQNLQQQAATGDLAQGDRSSIAPRQAPGVDELFHDTHEEWPADGLDHGATITQQNLSEPTTDPTEGDSSLGGESFLGSLVNHALGATESLLAKLAYNLLIGAERGQSELAEESECAHQRRSQVQQAGPPDRDRRPSLLECLNDKLDAYLKIFQVLSAFCSDFLDYQLETWRPILSTDSNSVPPGSPGSANKLKRLCRQFSFSMSSGINYGHDKLDTRILSSERKDVYAPVSDKACFMGSATITQPGLAAMGPIGLNSQHIYHLRCANELETISGRDVRRLGDSSQRLPHQRSVTDEPQERHLALNHQHIGLPLSSGTNQRVSSGGISPINPNDRSAYEQQYYWWNQANDVIGPNNTRLVRHNHRHLHESTALPLDRQTSEMSTRAMGSAGNDRTGQHSGTSMSYKSDRFGVPVGNQGGLHDGWWPNQQAGSASTPRPESLVLCGTTSMDVGPSHGGPDTGYRYNEGRTDSRKSRHYQSARQARHKLAATNSASLAASGETSTWCSTGRQQTASSPTLVDDVRRAEWWLLESEIRRRDPPLGGAENHQDKSKQHQVPAAQPHYRQHHELKRPMAAGGPAHSTRPEPSGWWTRLATPVDASGGQEIGRDSAQVSTRANGGRKPAVGSAARSSSSCSTSAPIPTGSRGNFCSLELQTAPAHGLTDSREPIADWMGMGASEDHSAGSAPAPGYQQRQAHSQQHRNNSHVHPLTGALISARPHSSSSGRTSQTGSVASSRSWDQQQVRHYNGVAIPITRPPAESIKDEARSDESGRPSQARPSQQASAGAGSHQVAGHSRKNNHSSSQLGRVVSLAGAKRRLGFKQKGVLSSLSVHRSEEVLPAESGHMLLSAYMQSATQANSLNESSFDESSSSMHWSSKSASAAFHAAPSSQHHYQHHRPQATPNDPRVCFVEGLGAGQIASRQALVSPYLGDVQLSLTDRRGFLEVEVIRVRQLRTKPDAKRIPSPYVKVYLMKGKKCVAKFKTNQVKSSLDPLFQQQFVFRDDYADCVLQVIVWGNYGKKDRKCLMGLAQIHLNDLDMSNVVIGWYKLFNAPSLASFSSLASSSKSLRQTISSTKLGDVQHHHESSEEPLTTS